MTRESLKTIHFGEHAQIVGNLDTNFLSVENMAMGTTPHHTHKKPATPTGLQNVPISPNIQIQPDGTALLIQQLVNTSKISQNPFEKTVENLNEIAEGMKMIKQQNDQIVSVNKKIYNR